MSRQFGRLLRKTRTEAGLTMGDLARALTLTVPYISDVERGNRGPLSVDRIIQAAKQMKTDPTPLLAAAAEERGTFELPTRSSPKAREVGAALMRGWGGLSDEELEKIAGVLKKQGEGE